MHEAYCKFYDIHEECSNKHRNFAGDSSKDLVECPGGDVGESTLFEVSQHAAALAVCKGTRQKPRKNMFVISRGCLCRLVG